MKRLVAVVLLLAGACGTAVRIAPDRTTGCSTSLPT
jgi:hypothetical protein